MIYRPSVRRVIAINLLTATGILLVIGTGAEWLARRRGFQAS
ncbi:MAG TPA: hypothetical protein VEK08_19580 [Planctomycetota bacterium]|nr:hypothetical protein [Planctomycetota bacterium]